MFETIMRAVIFCGIVVFMVSVEQSLRQIAKALQVNADGDKGGSSSPKQ